MIQPMRGYHLRLWQVLAVLLPLLWVLALLDRSTEVPAQQSSKQAEPPASRAGANP